LLVQVLACKVEFKSNLLLVLRVLSPSFDPLPKAVEEGVEVRLIFALTLDALDLVLLKPVAMEFPALLEQFPATVGTGGLKDISRLGQEITEPSTDGLEPISELLIARSILEQLVDALDNEALQRFAVGETVQEGTDRVKSLGGSF
jgi:hypothetical protein